ncbi:MAG: phosphonopyruvate decarboxylase [Desulfobacteraceae bacterium]|nr:phosphonopyruvate decarboxylase [Desulfobacteraceae bacterium]
MISCSFFYSALIREGIDFFAGIPDSLLKSFCAYITEHTDSGKHIIAANEGGAIALACGYHLATDKTGLVYMQNSGQGNAANPLISLADPEVYSIPILLLIGWRGEPGKKDEPQHVKQGKITLSFLDTLNIPYKILPDTDDGARQCLEQSSKLMKDISAPVALIVRRGIFEPYQTEEYDDCLSELTREAAIKEVVNNIGELDIIVSTTGKTSRELYEYRDALDGDHSKDFLAVGSMGHASQIALGIALAKPQRQTFVLDGDGAVIMHMGALATIGSHKVKNFKHIVFNNGSHDSVGGQPTCGFSVSLTNIAKACGYTLALQAQTPRQIDDNMNIIKSSDGPSMLEILVRKGARDNLGRPKTSPVENKQRFMEFLQQ